MGKEDGKRGEVPIVQEGPFQKRQKGKSHFKMEYFKLLDKKYVSAVFKQKKMSCQNV